MLQGRRETEREFARCLPRNAKETVMNEPGGWLWAIIGVFGIGGLAIAMAYGSALWNRRRKDWATRREQAETVHENYRRGG
jgi:hypothetical protein